METMLGAAGRINYEMDINVSTNDGSDLCKIFKKSLASAPNTQGKQISELVDKLYSRAAVIVVALPRIQLQV
jgi:hypothetical protein